MGLNYGPHFRKLSNINAVNGSRISTAELRHQLDESLATRESRYIYHPAVMDNLFQLSLIAAHLNLPYKLSKRFLPCSFGSIVLRTPLATDLFGPFQVAASADLAGVRALKSEITMAGASSRILVQVKDAVFLASDSGPTEPIPSASPYLRLNWKPDINFMESSTLNSLHPPASLDDEFGTAPLNRLAILQIVQFHQIHLQQFQIDSDRPNLQNFLAWVSRKAELARQGEIPGGKSIFALTSDERSDQITALSEKLKPYSPEARTMCNIYENLAPILDSKRTGIEVALEDNLLFDMYETGKAIHEGNKRLANMLELITHKHPSSRILEIGAGTGSATKEILPKLRGDSVFRTYKEYVFSDITPFFLKKAEENFRAFRGVTYTPFDMERSVEDQEVAPHFDVLVAANVTISSSLKPPKVFRRMLIFWYYSGSSCCFGHPRYHA